MNRLKQLTLNSLLVVGSMSMGIILCEIYLRIANISYPVFTTVDEYRGFALLPGASGWYRQEGEAYVQINTDGWRDLERSKVKPDDTLRIAILGDSFTEARQVSQEETFVAVTEEELNQCHTLNGQKVEVLNFGVGGYGTAQQLITLRRHVWEYSPDIVVLAAFLGNDIEDNSQELGYSTYSPYFVYQDGKLLPKYPSWDTPRSKIRNLLFNNPIFNFLNQHSRVSQVILENVRNQSRKTLQNEVNYQQDTNPQDQLSSQELAVASGTQAYIKQSSEAWKQAWKVTEGLMVLMRNEVVQKDAEFLVVTVSNSFQVHPDPSFRQELSQKLKIDNLFYPDERIKSLGEQHNFEVLNLAQPLQEYAEQANVCLHGFDNTLPCSGHWNSQGHQLAGKMIAQKLCLDYVASEPNKIINQ